MPPPPVYAPNVNDRKVFAIVFAYAQKRRISVSDPASIVTIVVSTMQIIENNSVRDSNRPTSTVFITMTL